MTANQRYRKALPGRIWNITTRVRRVKTSNQALMTSCRIQAVSWLRTWSTAQTKVDLPTLQSWLGQLD